MFAITQLKGKYGKRTLEEREQDQFLHPSSHEHLLCWKTATQAKGEVLVPHSTQTAKTQPVIHECINNTHKDGEQYQI